MAAVDTRRRGRVEIVIEEATGGDTLLSSFDHGTKLAVDSRRWKLKLDPLYSQPHRPQPSLHP
jgi:hypothetical protein